MLTDINHMRVITECSFV